MYRERLGEEGIPKHKGLMTMRRAAAQRGGRGPSCSGIPSSSSLLRRNSQVGETTQNSPTTIFFSVHLKLVHRVFPRGSLRVPYYLLGNLLCEDDPVKCTRVRSSS
jgi:hypothetical protein